MRHLLSRLLLAAFFAAAAWYFWYTPSPILGARVLDLEGEYRARIVRKKAAPPSFAAANAARRSFVRYHTNPGSAQRYRAAVLSSRPLPKGLSVSHMWARAVGDAPRGQGPFADRCNGDLVYFSTEAAPMDVIATALRHSMGQTGFLNAYATVGQYDLEFMVFPQSRSSEAPTVVLYPRRGTSLVLALAGLGMYGLVGWPRRIAVRYDPLPVLVLDVAAAVGFGFLFALPLRLASSTQAALADPLGGPLWFWVLSLFPLFGLSILARRAAFGIELAPDALHVYGLFGRRVIPFADVEFATDGARNKPHSDWQLKLRSGERMRLRWVGMLGALSLVHRMKQLRLLPQVPGSPFP